MMNPDYAPDGTDEDGSETTTYGVELRHALRVLHAAQQAEAEARRIADLSAAFREPSLVRDFQRAILAEAEMSDAAYRVIKTAQAMNRNTNAA